MNVACRRLFLGVTGGCRRSRRNFCVQQRRPPLQVCIVGSGPSGFYTANYLLQHNADVKIDMIEKSPVPYGLVRFGVAPDHPEIKNVITTFQNIAANSRFDYHGNVDVGKDITMKDLQECYHAVVLCTGCADERKLGIPNEDYVVSAQQFVGWYNGVEEHANLNLDLDCEEVAVIGHGNVALDVARILLKPLAKLKETDICEHAVQILAKSRVKRVHLVGRRGPAQVNFTTAEIREVLHFPGCRSVLLEDDFSDIAKFLKKMERGQKRVAELMLKATKPPLFEFEDNCQIHFCFKRSPLDVILNKESNKVETLKLGINKLVETSKGAVIAEATGQTEDLQCGMVIRSIGYLGVPPEATVGLPFNKRHGLVENINGKITQIPGLYCSGWIRTGPVGVINTTLACSQDTACTILADIKNSAIPSIQDSKPGFSGIETQLRKKGIKTVSFEEWRKIDREEVERGKRVGKCREKIISREEMLKIAQS